MNKIQEVIEESKARSINREEVRAFGAPVNGAQEVSFLQKWAAKLRLNMRINHPEDVKSVDEEKTFRE